MIQTIMTPTGFISAYDLTLAEIGGDIATGLYLTQHNYWQAVEGDAEGFIQRTEEEWHQRTRLTRRQQARIRSDLIQRGFLETKREGLPARLHTRLVVETLQNEVNMLLRNIADTRYETLPTLATKSSNILYRRFKKDNKKDILYVHFEDFWKKYPRREGKTKASKSWGTEECDSVWQEINLALDNHPCLKVARQFIPLPATFINQRRWEDEYAPESGSGWLDHFANEGNE